jgi:hypothetical protein
MRATPIKSEPKTSANIKVSSGGISQPYQVIGIVIGFASTTDSCGSGVKVESTYQAALDRLVESAVGKGANGLLFVSFQNRTAVAQGCAGPSQAFEVFAWGTAVRLAPPKQVASSPLPNPVSS